MTTEAITIEVDSKAAEAFKAAPREEQRKMEVLLSLWLLDAARTKDRSLTDVNEGKIQCPSSADFSES